MIDFLIIGGGIAGVSAAARLSELGSVTLLEGENALAYHASGRSAALFEQNYGKTSTVALNKASRTTTRLQMFLARVAFWWSQAQNMRTPLPKTKQPWTCNQSASVRQKT